MLNKTRKWSSLHWKRMACTECIYCRHVQKFWCLDGAATNMQYKMWLFDLHVLMKWSSQFSKLRSAIGSSKCKTEGLIWLNGKYFQINMLLFRQIKSGLGDIIYPPGTKYQVPWSKPEGIRSTHVPNISKPRGRGLQQGHKFYVKYCFNHQNYYNVTLNISNYQCYCKCGIQYFTNHHNCYKFKVKYFVKYQD